MRPGNLLRLARNRLHGVRDIPVPAELAAKHKPLLDQGLLERSLETHYFKRTQAELVTEDERYDWQDHLTIRMQTARKQIVPWFASVSSLPAKRMLEIGCGTGSSTVAFAEQGAEITAIDIDADSLNAARDRLSAYGLDVPILCQSAIPEGSYDIVLMYAVLEHMTLDERLEALRTAWARLVPGGYLIVVETPNRLWYYDNHTAKEDFFLWLPDDLALRYAPRTPRPGYQDIATPLELARWGRGVSYHDFELALDFDAAALPVVSNFNSWERRVRRIGRLNRKTLDRRFEDMLREIHPDLPAGFEFRYLNLILQKPGA